MPLVANMRFDMFVSYAHVDNESMDLPGASNAEGWVSRVVRMLKISVAQRQGDRRFEVWLDSQHHDTGRLDELLKERIAQSGILLAVVSRGYLNSRYCLLEFDHFMSSHDAFKNRVVIVDTQDVFEDPIVRRDAQDKAVAGGYEDLFLRVVDECSRQKRMPFFQVTGPGRADPIDYTHGESASHDLRRKVADLAFNLSGKIDELKQLVKGAMAASAARVEFPASRIGVMVALSKESLKPRRDDIVRFLDSRREIHVLPEDESLLWPQAETREAFDARVREALKQAEIFVQLIGAPRLGEDGTLPVRSSELPDDFVRLQLEVAEELEKQPIIWCTPNLMNSDLTQVERDIRRKRSVIEDTIETLKRQIDTNVARLLKEKAKPAKSPAAADDHSVFFNYVHAGRDLVRPIADSFRAQSWDVFEPSSDAKVLETSYLECDAAILFGHHAPGPWMDAQLMEFKRVKGRRGPIRALALLKPASSPAPNIWPSPLKIVDVRDDEGPAELRKRVSELLTAAA